MLFRSTTTCSHVSFIDSDDGRNCYGYDWSSTHSSLILPCRRGLNYARVPLDVLVLAETAVSLCAICWVTRRRTIELENWRQCTRFLPRKNYSKLLIKRRRHEFNISLNILYYSNPLGTTQDNFEYITFFQIIIKTLTMLQNGNYMAYIFLGVKYYNYIKIHTLLV